jgi:ParB family chromosome partitioning protein
MEQPRIERIRIDLIDPPDEPDRIEIDDAELQELSESILAVGLLQPILITPRGERYEVVAGDRRFKAHQRAGMSEIDAIVRDMSPEEVALLRATENLSRKDLTPVEEARIYARLNEKYGLPWEKIGKKFGKSPGLVKRRTDILRMPECLRDALHQKKISTGVAEELWRIKDTTALEYYLSFAVENGVTVAVARQWAQDLERQGRTNQPDIGGGGGLRHPSESTPIYTACDLCGGPADMSKMSVVRCCRDCSALIEEALRTYQQQRGE